MPIMQIDNYLNSILAKQLDGFNLSRMNQEAICDNIRMQIISLVANWDNKEFLQGLLLLGQEEGRFDGYSEKIDPMLAAMLHDLHKGRLDIFYTPNFKTISRNIKKLLFVLEFVLSLGKPYVSYNYYAEKRERLISARRSTVAPVLTEQEIEGTYGELRDTLRSIITSQRR